MVISAKPSTSGLWQQNLPTLAADLQILTCICVHVFFNVRYQHFVTFWTSECTIEWFNFPSIGKNGKDLSEVTFLQPILLSCCLLSHSKQSIQWWLKMVSLKLHQIQLLKSYVKCLSAQLRWCWGMAETAFYVCKVTYEV